MKLRTGESLAQVLCLAGVRPISDSIGRVNKLELIPLEELGRPRVDVVVSCSGVFRDLFINQMNLLDRGVREEKSTTRIVLCTHLDGEIFSFHPVIYYISDKTLPLLVIRIMKSPPPPPHNPYYS